MLLPVVVAELALSTAAWAQQKQVLVLYSTRRDAQIAVVGERELPRILDEGLNHEVDYYSEYVDRSRFPDPEYQTGFRDFLKIKYQERRFDLVVAMDDTVLDFVRTNRAELFGNAPMVFFANSPGTERIPNSAGLISQLDMHGTLELALTLQPELRHVYVVAGADINDRRFLDAAQTQMRQFEPQVNVTYLTGLASQDLEARVAALPAQSIVYYLFVNRDANGQNFHPLEYLERLAMIANVPTYSWVDSAMDHGIVGGSLKSQATETQELGKLAVRILKGERADAIPLLTRDLNVKQVDWRQLQRWGLSEARVPAGTLVRFREPGAWERYKGYILGVLAILLLQSALIAGLLVQRIRRRRAEGDLRASQAELRTSYQRIRDLGSRLLNAQESERSRIARELHDDISQQASLLAIDLSMLRHGMSDPEMLADEALSRAENIVKSVHDLSHRLHPAKLRVIGLVAALRELEHEMTQAELPISFTYENVPPALPAELTLCLFRIAQETMQNAMKYSQARLVSVHLKGEPNGLCLSVTDDGIGFEVDRVWGKGLGLISMGERVEAVGGRFELYSKPGAGTKVEVRVPLSAVKDADSVAV